MQSLLMVFYRSLFANGGGILSSSKLEQYRRSEQGSFSPATPVHSADNDLLQRRNGARQIARRVI